MIARKRPTLKFKYYCGACTKKCPWAKMPTVSSLIEEPKQLPYKCFSRTVEEKV